ncbi:hypothetical protein SAMN02982989_3425 [Xaviernesmea oryzae]|uniref:DUF6950 domain-containing protein n=1 Tax=Xaviernesmea oryzae TaxID=464029 RepID=A0A1X7G8Q4_9HYPH|nr:hypothetical protein [Xaviernesmea oryzae]SMF65977.1 hypothetical protein SAMN02982989_3425 [Xaviernesmea oryzae]
MAELVTAVDRLDEFLSWYGSLPWSPGSKVDCCLTLAEWAIWLSHADPAAHLRGTYDSDDGFRAIIAAYQGVVPLVASCLPSAAAPTASPRRGDIGVIGARVNPLHQFGAIHDGRGWIVRQKQGFGRMSARTLAAWTITAK